MASEANHILLANKNQEALTYLLERPTHFSEWITTIAFYKAVHIVEAVFANDPKIEHCNDHGSRNRTLHNERRYRNISTHFRPLWQASTIARYLSDNDARQPSDYSTFSAYLKPDKVVSEMVNHRLRQVERSSLQFLTASAQATLVGSN